MMMMMMMMTGDEVHLVRYSAPTFATCCHFRFPRPRCQIQGEKERRVVKEMGETWVGPVTGDGEGMGQ